ncbi:unnamed protein product [Chrysoparadoxa australica]
MMITLIVLMTCCMALASEPARSLLTARIGDLPPLKDLPPWAVGRGLLATVISDFDSLETTSIAKIAVPGVGAKEVVARRFASMAGGYSVWSGDLGMGVKNEGTVTFVRTPSGETLCSIHYTGLKFQRRFECSPCPRPDIDPHCLLIYEKENLYLPELEREVVITPSSSVHDDDEPGIGMDEVVPAISQDPMLTSDGKVVVDIMVLYTEAALARWGQAHLEGLIVMGVSDANEAYENSNVGMELRLVHTGVVDDYSETGDILDSLVSLQDPSDGKMDGAHVQRERYGADLVQLVTEDSNACGVGYTLTSMTKAMAPYAFSVVCSDCLDQLTPAHEMGHNMGLAHNRGANTKTGAYDHGYGYRKCGDWRTIMSYSCMGEPRIKWFSNPSINYYGEPTGISMSADPDNAANNAKALEASRLIVGTFMDSTVPLDERPVPPPFIPTPPPSSAPTPGPAGPAEQTPEVPPAPIPTIPLVPHPAKSFTSSVLSGGLELGVGRAVYADCTEVDLDEEGLRAKVNSALLSIVLSSEEDVQVESLELLSSCHSRVTATLDEGPDAVVKTSLDAAGPTVVMGFAFTFPPVRNHSRNYVAHANAALSELVKHDSMRALAATVGVQEGDVAIKQLAVTQTMLDSVVNESNQAASLGPGTDTSAVEANGAKAEPRRGLLIGMVMLLAVIWGCLMLYYTRLGKQMRKSAGKLAWDPPGSDTATEYDDSESEISFGGGLKSSSIHRLKSSLKWNGQMSKSPLARAVTSTARRASRTLSRRSSSSAVSSFSFSEKDVQRSQEVNGVGDSSHTSPNTPTKKHLLAASPLSPIELSPARSPVVGEAGWQPEPCGAKTPPMASRRYTQQGLLRRSDSDGTSLSSSMSSVSGPSNESLSVGAMAKLQNFVAAVPSPWATKRFGPQLPQLQTELELELSTIEAQGGSEGSGGVSGEKQDSGAARLRSMGTALVAEMRAVGGRRQPIHQTSQTPSSASSEAGSVASRSIGKSSQQSLDLAATKKWLSSLGNWKAEAAKVEPTPVPAASVGHSGLTPTLVEQPSTLSGNVQKLETRRHSGRSARLGPALVSPKRVDMAESLSLPAADRPESGKLWSGLSTKLGPVLSPRPRSRGSAKIGPPTHRQRRSGSADSAASSREARQCLRVRRSSSDGREITGHGGGISGSGVRERGIVASAAGDSSGARWGSGADEAAAGVRNSGIGAGEIQEVNPVMTQRPASRVWADEMS